LQDRSTPIAKIEINERQILPLLSEGGRGQFVIIDAFGEAV
jgi:hypothetical protein